MTVKSGFLVLGNQLFPSSHFLKYKSVPFFMAEDLELCTYVKHHKQKIVLFLASMRSFRDEMHALGYELDYCELARDGQSQYRKNQSIESIPLLRDLKFEDKLKLFCATHLIEKIICFEIEDTFFEDRIKSFCKEEGVGIEFITSPMFLCTRDDFRAYLKTSKRPFMKTFYERQRRAGNILLENGRPIGGQFSFDEENRKKIPKSMPLAVHKAFSPTANAEKCIQLTVQLFPEHPGDLDTFSWPTSLEQIHEQFENFLSERLSHFGEYQDAMTDRCDFLFHSLISPAINMGRLTPQYIIERSLKVGDQLGVPLNSLEGFIRQVIGWREFVRGIYQNYRSRMETSNHWNHNRQAGDEFWNGKTGVVPFDLAINKAFRLGYCHHIERLMILANFMNLCEISPPRVYRYFMENFVDSSDWVMQANVFGMGLQSDGGIFSTKPYISGSNYIRKMSDYPAGDWCDVWDGLYWRFVESNFERLKANPRTSMTTLAFSKLSSERKGHLKICAQNFLDKYTTLTDDLIREPKSK